MFGRKRKWKAVQDSRVRATHVHPAEAATAMMSLAQAGLSGAQAGKAFNQAVKKAGPMFTSCSTGDHTNVSSGYCAFDYRCYVAPKSKYANFSPGFQARMERDRKEQLKRWEKLGIRQRLE